MLTLFYLLVVQQIAQGLYSLWQGVLWLRMARRRLSQPTGFFTPRVALFCPVKGLEPGLEENLTALTLFDYPEYEIFLAVSGVDDPAYRLLEHVAALSKHPVHIVRAGRANDCGDKVNKLRKAGEKFDLFVFTDSDGRPPRRWHRRYQRWGYDGLWDRRRGRPSPRRAPRAQAEQVLGLYGEKYFDFNVRHFRSMNISMARSVWATARTPWAGSVRPDSRCWSRCQSGGPRLWRGLNLASGHFTCYKNRTSSRANDSTVQR